LLIAIPETMLILGFAVHHVYSSVLMSQVEARGTVESMASGYKFVPCEDLVYSGYRYLDPKDIEPVDALRYE
jgi:hypothetical protein